MLDLAIPLFGTLVYLQPDGHGGWRLSLYNPQTDAMEPLGGGTDNGGASEMLVLPGDPPDALTSAGDYVWLVRGVTAPVAPVVAIPDAGFELRVQGSGLFTYDPTGSAWSFTGGAGLSGNGSGFTHLNDDAPEGAQIAFLQYNDSVISGQIKSSATFQATLRFSASSRGGYPTTQVVTALLDGAPIGIFPILNSTSYQDYVSAPFMLGIGQHTLVFQGTGPSGDIAAFIDNIRID